MPKVFPIQTNFVTGEVSPLIQSRVDSDKFFSGAKTLENFIVLPQGGITRRSGTRYLGEVKDSSKFTRLIEFEFSTIQAYILEFGHEYIRVHKDEGTVESAPGVPVEISTPYQYTELAELSVIQSADVLYICHKDHQPRKLSRTSHTTWTLSLFESLDGPYLPANTTDQRLALINGDTIDRATLTSTAADFSVGDIGDWVEFNYEGIPRVAQIKAFIDSNTVTIEPIENVIGAIDSEITFETIVTTTLTVSHSYFVKGNVGSYIKVTNLSGAGAAGWYLITGYDGQNRDQVTINATALTLVATTGVLWMSDRIITTSVNTPTPLFSSTDVGRHIRMNLSSEQLWMKITAFVSETYVNVQVFDRPIPLKEDDSTDIRDDGVTYDWRLGAWSDSTGWPACIVFHEERLVFANTATQPQTLWMSKSGDYERFSPTEPDSLVLDNSGVSYTIASKKLNSILWLESAPVLLLGTTGAEWQVRASSISEPITPTNISISQQTTHGSKNVKPEHIGPAILFVQRTGNKVRELMYSYEIDAYTTIDLTLVSEHIFRNGNGATDSTYQLEENGVVWFVRSDGQLIGLTYSKDQKLAAWHRHILGGSFNSGLAVVESVAAVLSADQSHTTIYVIVKRTINGQTKRYIEYFDELFHPTGLDDKDYAFFVDCGLTYDGIPATTISGLDHLEGESVAILADGAVIPNQVVVSGQIELYTAASVVHAGLGFTSLVTTLPVEHQTSQGTAQGRIKRITKLTVRLLESLGFKYGARLTELSEESFRLSDGSMNSSPNLFTGDRTIDLQGDYETDGSFHLVQDRPYPLTILAFMPEVQIQDESK